MMLKLGHFGKHIRITWNIFEMWCWRRVENFNCIDRV